MIFRKLRELLSPPTAVVHDETFGHLRREGDGPWYGEVMFPEATGAVAAQVDVTAGPSGPTETQRQLYRDIVAQYPKLWPQIVAALAVEHNTLRTADAIAQHISAPSLSIDAIVDAQPRKWSLQYTFDLDTEGDAGYFVDFVEWELTRIEVVD